ncbi:mechanosensitive ion channel family protein [Marivirga sp. S37H4]|uniref:Mechanosensitive ion channel family protein n=1 Tax=Marivirga aurantiaca TaxID=2802615 RepID=A0A934WYS0_9BACT|nr:mechanosensitive ion channel family protein [Marivirga aurantiaca]MBK6265668.1 mechanosensitive ion channel family protein [Marivirga aurantiaca]
MDDFLERVYYDNTVQEYLIAFGAIILGILIVKLFKKYFLKQLRKWANKTSTNIDDYIVNIIARFGIPALYAIIVYVIISSLTLSERAENIISIAITVVITYLIIQFVSTSIISLLKVYIHKQEKGEEKIKQIGGLILIINIIIWIIGLLFFFDNMGYDVTAVIAGLGVGGIAIALAAQNILGDLFNYFVIFFDRPFEVGDFLIIDDKLGVVEYIGVKTTRIKSLSGEQLVFSNSDLTNSRIHNYKKMAKRRVVFGIGVTYETPFQKLKKIPDLLRSIVEEQEDITFDRSHFQKYGDSSLDFEVVYYVAGADYNKYMDIQEAINFRIFEEFEKMDVTIAYPTRTLYVVNENEEKEKHELAEN